MVTQDGGSFRFVSLGEYEAVRPLWTLNPRIEETHRMEWELGWESGQPRFGFYKRTSRWNYRLSGNRMDGVFKDDELGPLFLSEAQLNDLRPLVISELNRRKPGERQGDRLQALLSSGVECTSYACLQNALVLVAWLSLPLSMVALVAMFVEPRGTRTDGAVQPSPTDQPVSRIGGG
jgi:hypothetical protein